MTRGRFIILLCVGLINFAVIVRAQMPSVPPIWGAVFSTSQGGRPIGGVTVSLVHPALGRSTPSVTDYYGRYAFFNVSPRPEPYYIEAYWGAQLLFRGQLLYHGGSVQYNIPLP